MTRVLMTTDTVGGVWTYALELASALAPLNVEVVLATMGRPMTVDQRAAVEASPVVAVHESEFALEWMDEPWEDVERAGVWLLELEAAVAPDVVHLNGYVHGAQPWRAPTVVVGHSCVLSWWAAVRGEQAPPAWDTYRERVTAGLHAAGAVVAPTQAMASELTRWYGVARVHIVPNSRAVTATGARPAAKEPIILTAGRAWDDAKNVAALSAVAGDVPWPILVAGDATHPDGGHRALDGVEMLGLLPHDDLQRWMQRAAVFALPARYEPFGLAALEAALSHCALVLGDIPSLREVWGDAALFVDPDDHLALTDALRRVAGDVALRGDLAERAHDRASTFTPERTAAGYLDVYSSLPVAAGERL
jgi:glycogen(starch) synthase